MNGPSPWAWVLVCTAACTPAHSISDSEPEVGASSGGEAGFVDGEDDARRVRMLDRRLAHHRHPYEELAGNARELLEHHCPMGAPLLGDDWNQNVARVVARRGYALLHSSEDRIPVFVCERLTVEALNGTFPRPDPEPFHEDQSLPANERATLADYRGSGYDRGHLAPSADFAHDQELQAESFALSNMVPQVGVGFNRSTWAALEEQVREWLRARGGGWVISGSIFHDPAEADPATADGWVEFERIGPNQVAVPTHLFKIVVAEVAGRVEALAFVMANERHADTQAFRRAIESIDWIEAATGIDFMPQLGAEDAARVESSTNGDW